MNLSREFNKRILTNVERKRTVFDISPSEFRYLDTPKSKTLLAKIGKNFPECFDYFYQYFLISDDIEIYEKNIDRLELAESYQDVEIGKAFSDFEDLDRFFSQKYLRRVPKSIDLGSDDDAIYITYKRGNKDGYILITDIVPARCDSFHSVKESIFEQFINSEPFNMNDFFTKSSSYWYTSQYEVRIFNKDVISGILFFLINREEILELHAESSTILEKIVKYSNELSENQNYVVSSSVGKTARVFETKRNISDKNFLAMKESSLNNYFKFVEFDNDIDLEKVKLFEKEVENLPNQILLPILNKNDLRFRKLGRHNASGIFFPIQKCIGVDVRSSTSFIHEIGHAIDYSRNEKTYSVESNFENIREVMRNFMKENKIENFKYYSSATEIFARAFEFYFLNKFNLNHNFDVISKDSSRFDHIALQFNEAGLRDEVMNYFEKLFIAISFNSDLRTELSVQDKVAEKINGVKMRSSKLTSFESDKIPTGVQISIFDLI